MAKYRVIRHTDSENRHKFKAQIKRLFGWKTLRRRVWGYEAYYTEDKEFSSYSEAFKEIEDTHHKQLVVVENSTWSHV
jgi:hypothetical protein